MTLKLIISFFIFSSCCLQLANAENSAIFSHYEIYCTGRCNKDFTSAVTQPGVVLMGGGVYILIINILFLYNFLNYSRLILMRHLFGRFLTLGMEIL